MNKAREQKWGVHFLLYYFHIVFRSIWIQILYSCHFRPIILLFTFAEFDKQQLPCLSCYLDLALLQGEASTSLNLHGGLM